MRYGIQGILRGRGALLGLALVAAASCSGGGGSAPAGLRATFTATNANPGPNTVSMAPGDSAAAVFDLQILVSDITDFFGAAFHVVYDPSGVRYTGFDGSTSLLHARGDPTRFDVDSQTAGVLIVDATLFGSDLEGLDVIGTKVLLTLSFRATQTTGGNAFRFDPGAALVVKICPTPPAACSDLPGVTWSGGTLVVR